MSKNVVKHPQPSSRASAEEDERAKLLAWLAQYKPRTLNDPATGEKYHIEAGADLWWPTADMVVSSERAKAASARAQSCNVHTAGTSAKTPSRVAAVQASSNAAATPRQANRIPIASTTGEHTGQARSKSNCLPAPCSSTPSLVRTPPSRPPRARRTGNGCSASPGRAGPGSVAGTWTCAWNPSTLISSTKSRQAIGPAAKAAGPFLSDTAAGPP